MASNMLTLQVGSLLFNAHVSVQIIHYKYLFHSPAQLSTSILCVLIYLAMKKEEKKERFLVLNQAIEAENILRNRHKQLSLGL